MRLVARRQRCCTNGTVYDSREIARKAYRRATRTLMREAETVSTHEQSHGAVRLLDAPDHGYVLAVEDEARDIEEAHVSADLDEMIGAYQIWARALA